MEKDAEVKRARFIDSAADIADTFGFANPVEILTATKLYACSLYGSMTWNLFGDRAGQLFRSWNTCVKLAWNVPRSTHTYFVSHLLCGGHNSLRVDVMGRYVKFFWRLKSSASMEVRVMAAIAARDVRSTTGGNLAGLSAETGLDLWTTSAVRVRRVLQDQEPQPSVQDMWRVAYLEKLLRSRGNLHYLGENTEHISQLIDAICIN